MPVTKLHRRTLERLVRQQISFARFGNSLKDSDVLEGLYEECLGLCIAAGLLERHRVDPVAVARIVRRRLRKERKEFRWLEDDNGKQVRRSKSVLVLKQPVQIHDAESPDITWSEPLEEVCADSEGKFCGSSTDPRNTVEGRMIERLDTIADLTKLRDIVGREALDWMVAYVDCKHNGTPLSKSARNRFAYLKKKVIQSLGAERRLKGVGKRPNILEEGMKTTKTTRTMTLRSNPRTLTEQEAWLSLLEQERVAGRLKLPKMSRKEKRELDEFVVTTFWGIGQKESAPVVVRLQALEHLALIVSATKSKLLEQVAAV